MANQKEEKPNICTLCLNCCDNNFTYIDNSINKALQFILTKQNTLIGEESILCNKCVENVEKCLDLKSVCLHTENCINSYTNRKGQSKQCLNDIYIEKNNNIVPEDCTVCRLCIELVEYWDAIDLEKILVLFRHYFPEVDINITDEPKFCTTCHESLKDYFSFVGRCLDAETRTRPLKSLETVDKNLEILNPQTFDIKTETRNEQCVDDFTVLAKYSFTSNDNKDIAVDEVSYDIKCEELDMKIEPDDLDRDLEKIIASESEVTPVKIFTCDICGLQTKYELILKRHIMSNHNKNKTVRAHQIFACHICGLEKKCKDVLERHIKFKHKEKQSQCDDKSTAVVQTYQPASKTYTCEICGLQTKYELILKRHIMSNHNKNKTIRGHRIFTCEICGLEKRCKDALERHIKFEHHKKPSQWDDKSTEVVQTYQPASKTYTCEICGLETKYELVLKRHLMSGHNKIMYECKFCDYMTDNKGHFKQHLVRHRHILQCNLCDFKTRYKSCLRKHEELHVRPLPDVRVRAYECDFCWYQTNNKYNFDVHVEEHEIALNNK